MAGSGFILAFDQAPTHAGWSLLDIERDRVMAFGSQVFESGRAAASYVLEVALYWRARREIRAIALEGVNLVHRGGKAIWSAAEPLVELRGRILTHLEPLQHRIEIVKTYEWQVQFLGISIGTKSPEVKKASMRLARPFLDAALDASLLTEDGCDSVHIARTLRNRIIAEDRSRTARRIA